MLHSYANDVHERALGAALEAALPDLFVTLSSDVCREFREFERTSTVVANAFIGPVVQRYIDRLGDDLSERNIPLSNLLLAPNQQFTTQPASILPHFLPSFK